MTKIIKKKCYTPFFELIKKGDKNIELRLNDFEVNDGDILVLYDRNPDTGELTGRFLKKKIVRHYTMNPTHWYDIEKIKTKGFVVMELEEYNETTEETFRLIRKETRNYIELADKYPNEWILFKDDLNRDIIEVIGHHEDEEVIEKMREEAEKDCKDGEFLHDFFGDRQRETWGGESKYDALETESVMDVVLQNLKFVHCLLFQLEDLKNRSLVLKYLQNLIRLFVNDESGVEFEYLKDDLKEQIIDADNSLIVCSECGNDEKFNVYIDELHLKLEKGTNRIIDLNAERRMTKPSDIIFVCPHCKKVMLESLIY